MHKRGRADLSSRMCSARIKGDVQLKVNNELSLLMKKGIRGKVSEDQNLLTQSGLEFCKKYCWETMI